MQKFSKEELQPQAEKFMAAHKVDSFLATEDGNFFHPKDKGLAHDHNNKNVKGEVHVFSAKTESDEATSMKHIVTQEDLDNNPELAEKVSVGDEIEIPVPPSKESQEKIKADLAAQKEDMEKKIAEEAAKETAAANRAEDVERHGEPRTKAQKVDSTKPKAKAKGK